MSTFRAKPPSNILKTILNNLCRWRCHLQFHKGERHNLCHISGTNVDETRHFPPKNYLHETQLLLFPQKEVYISGIVSDIVYSLYSELIRKLISCFLWQPLIYLLFTKYVPRFIRFHQVCLISFLAINNTISACSKALHCLKSHCKFIGATLKIANNLFCICYACQLVCLLHAHYKG